MGRKGVIAQHGLSAKVGGLLSAGVPYDQIVRQIEREHGLTLTFSQLSRFGKKNIASIDSELPSPEAISTISSEIFKQELLAAVNTAKARYEEFQHDPRSGLAWFRTHLENLDRMARAVGAYSPESQVNIGVQVGQRATRPLNKPLVEQLKESEAYFQSIEDARVCPHCGKPDKETPDKCGIVTIE